jgi:hypothetical protein
MKKNLPYIVILASSAVVFFIIRMLTPEPVDWSESFSRKDKIPYGCHIIYELLPDIFPGAQVSAVHDSAYDTLKNRTFRGANYIIIDNTAALDKYDTDELMRFVATGNNVFIAAGHYPDEFGKRMNIRTAPEDAVADRMGVNFTNPRIAARRNYVCRKGTGNFRFVSFRKKGAAVLGVNERRGANFLRIRHGKGAFYLSAIPYAYSNFAVLTQNNAEYVSKSLSYLPVQRTFWDEHYKSSLAAPTSPLRYVLSREPLTWAYYAGMAFLMLFILFRARRRQRVIPVIAPLKNATLDFIATVGRLYFQQGDHKNIAEKKILYFYEYLNSQFQVDALHRGHDFMERVAAVTGAPPELVRKFFNAADSIRMSERISDDQLVSLNGIVEEFKRVTHAAGERGAKSISKSPLNPRSAEWY